ncbi:acetyltransferas-like protein, partial [Saccharata proteae CBS 121410]
DPLADIPPLDTYVAETEADKVAALKLVADSVAQQRQSASWAVISNPSVVAVWVLALAVAAHFLYRDSSDWPTMLTTGTGVTMAALVAVRFFTSKYITLAEGVNWSFLDEADAVVVSRWGDTVIGACVVSLVGGQGNRGQRRRKRGVVRAWTVGLKWRGKGIGMGLLEEACKVVGGRGGDGIEFADEHANAVRVLHPFFNSPFDVRDERAREALKVAVRSTSAFGKKR